MYFPFLRGKQFELIALRELCNWGIPHDKLSVVIEPVKLNFSSLDKTIRELNDHKINFNIIINPIVGDFSQNYEDIEPLFHILNLFENFQLCYYLSNNNNLDFILTRLKESKLRCKGISFIHLNELDVNDTQKKFNDIYPTIYNILKVDSLSRSYTRNIEQDTKILLSDHFKAQQKNSDYLLKEDYFFSDDNLFYKTEGFIGFSDYTVIGESYIESGFLPYAVAIHLTYRDTNNIIRIHHFVSDSNEDTSDVAGKFMEALTKLVDWTNTYNINSRAIESFKELHAKKAFPGLGTIKKLSILNHFEVILNTI